MQQVQVAHVSEKKKQEVEKIKDLVKKFNVLGILNLENLPADQYIKIKHKLQGKVLIKTTKKRLLKIAFSQLEKEKTGISKLNEMIKGSPALLLTNEDELLIKEGEEINTKIASILSKLGIEPMEIGLNLIFTFKNGEILTKDILNIDEKEFLDSLMLAHQEAFNLAVNISYPTKETINILLKKAQIEAMALESKVPNLDSVSPKESEAKPFEERKEIEAKPEPIPESKETQIETKEQEEIIEKNEHKEPLKEELKHHDKIEVEKVDTSNDEMRKAADLLRQLTDKKIRGEI